MRDAGECTDREWVEQQVGEYATLFPRYREYARVLREILQTAAKRYAPNSLVQTRPKAIASFAEKIQRKKAELSDPVHEFTDLCGGRVVVHFQEELQAMRRFVEEHFEIDWANSSDVLERLRPTEFGYRSVHYIVSMKEGVFPSGEIPVEVPDEVYGLKAEIQVRTFLQHAWADTTHDLTYKSAFPIPQKWTREIARLAAMLEAIDGAFDEIQKGLRSYAANYGAYMPEAAVRQEIAKLQSVLRHDPGNAELADRIGKLAMTIGDWQTAVGVLLGTADSGYGPALRDLGTSLCKLHRDNPSGDEYRRGQQYLEWACAPPNRDSDALASLAGTWKGIDDEKARELYRRAFEVDPTDPYPLGNYLSYEIARQQSTAMIPLVRPVIESSIRRSRAQADVGMNLPWAFYNVGSFSLLLGDPYASLAAYAKAVQLTAAPFMVTASLGNLERLKPLRRDLEGYDWVRRFLSLALAAKFPRESPVEDPGTLAGRKRKQILGPVVLVAGGCEATTDWRPEDYSQMLTDAFAHFEGTVICGGTSVGVSGLVAGLAEKLRGSIRAIGYVPRSAGKSEAAAVDERYDEIRRTSGDGFSPLEPLQAWTDILASGIPASAVRLLGINGGRVAAAEYRVALALGATVGVIEDSGREAALLVADPDWAQSPNLLKLPKDAPTVAAFLCERPAQLAEGLREAVARGIHEEYRRTQAQQPRPQPPSLPDWPGLSDNLKESNLQQADDILSKLRRISCTVHEVKGREVALMTFTDDEVESMAAMEHARWNVERLRDGWRRGPEKDVEKKISPYLVGWDELPENVKEWDRNTVRAIPRFLAEVGLEIRRG
jgi:ppGpp synthetase/RelA/SpoT-type nucleotidyltranferase